MRIAMAGGREVHVMAMALVPHLEDPVKASQDNHYIHKTTTFKEAEHCILTDHVRYTASLSMEGERIYSWFLVFFLSRPFLL